MFELLIFDFDGVVADSESLACAIAAAYATELGAPMSAQEGLNFMMGKRVTDVAALIAERGGAVPEDFADELLKRTLEGFAGRLEPVAGVESFLQAHRGLKRCIASSSSHRRLAVSLEKLGLQAWFDGRVFSVDEVARGKPSPDIFLHAANRMAVAPGKTLVIEDSVTGVKAGAAAGMSVAGLLAGSHIGPDHADALRSAGATLVVESYAELSAWMTGRNG